MKNGKTPPIESTMLLPAAIQESIELAQKYEQKDKMEETHRFNYTLYRQGLPPYECC